MQTLIHSRGSLLAHIADVLTHARFEQVNSTWVKEFDVQMPGDRVIVNGCIMEAPGPTIHIKFECEPLGPGQVLSDKNEVEHEFELVRFDIFQDREHLGGIHHGIYFNEFELFDHLAQVIFRI